MPTRGLRCTPVTEALPGDTLPQHTLSQVASMQPHAAADLSTTPEQPLGIYGRTMVLLPYKDGHQQLLRATAPKAKPLTSCLQGGPLDRAGSCCCMPRTTEATPITHGWEMVFHTGSSKLYFPFRIWSNSAGSLSS